MTHEITSAGAVACPLSPRAGRVGGWCPANYHPRRAHSRTHAKARLPQPGGCLTYPPGTFTGDSYDHDHRPPPFPPA